MLESQVTLFHFPSFSYQLFRGLDKSLEKCKKKYQAKMNKLEQQLLQLSLANNNNLTNPSRERDEQQSTKPDIQVTTQATLNEI